MPGLDGTGPQGQGAMTGGGFGRCTGNTGYGVRPCFGRGGGRGNGRGMGQGRYYAGAGYQGNAANQMMDDSSRKQFLDNQITSLAQEIEQLKKQREALD
ncbi:MAG: DUF5320 domain-containing protein [Desulfoplanes sp.]